MHRVGFTTTLPIEAILAADLVPVDLNNAFVAGPDTEADIRTAERAGFPRSMCAWIKGIYGTIKRLGIKRIVGVLEGDCSYTEGLMDVLEHEGYEVIGFRFPREPDPMRLKEAVKELAQSLGVTLAAVSKKWHELRPLRNDLRRLDDLTVEGVVAGGENFSYLINASDFKGDPAGYGQEIRQFLADAEKRAPMDGARAAQPPSAVARVAAVGIPPAFTDFFDFLEKRGVQVVYNEMPYEFAMVHPAGNIFEQYSEYTYPYPFRHRLARIKEEVARRRVDGVIHYVQTFCYRGIHDRLLRDALDVPLLTLEGDRPAPIGSREEVRLESFIEMLSGRRKGASPGKGGHGG